MQTLLQDLRYGARMLLKEPGFTLVAVLMLALGVGANTAIFSVINSLMLRPLPYREPDRLVKVYQAEPDPVKGMLPSVWSYPRFEVLRDQSRSFAAVAAVAQLQNNLTGANEPERLHVEVVSASYFPMLGVEAEDAHSRKKKTERPAQTSPPCSVSVCGSGVLAPTFRRSERLSNWTNIRSRLSAWRRRDFAGRTGRRTRGRR